MKVKYQTYLTKTVAEYIDRKAKENDTSKSNIIEEIIKEHIRREKKK